MYTHSKKHKPKGPPRVFKPSKKNTVKSGVSYDLEKMIQTERNKNREEFTVSEPQPFATFKDFQLTKSLGQAIDAGGYIHPTEIQAKSYFKIRNGENVVGIAGTGTGKTAAFLIPLIQQMHTNRRENTTLVITPTRELASQIIQEFSKLTKSSDLKSLVIIGGTDINRAERELKNRMDLIVATPGRLLDLIRRNSFQSAAVKKLVLDEFDRMLDMGFISDIRNIVNSLVNRNQTLLFSATHNKFQEPLIREFSGNSHWVFGSKPTYTGSGIEQELIRLEVNQNKLEVIENLISEADGKVLLFCETKHLVRKIHKKLVGRNINALSIHGDKSQSARENALKQFKNGSNPILVATNVVARGIDISDVLLVINYTVPRDFSDYVHRVGRTGRAGMQGRAVTFLD
ncbi:MAG: DEAD/DEAH box helicase [Bacteroidetes bacterium]|nr:DEAD/DEAH box helicase [Bacteroidota bacterium]